MRKRYIREMCKAVFEQINEEMFNNALPPIKIKIHTRCKRSATFAVYWENKIAVFYKEIKAIRFFPHQVFAIVAHETIHHAQKYYGQGYGHNTAFFRHFARKMKFAYGHEILANQLRYE